MADNMEQPAEGIPEDTAEGANDPSMGGQGMQPGAGQGQEMAMHGGHNYYSAIPQQHQAYPGMPGQDNGSALMRHLAASSVSFDRDNKGMGGSRAGQIMGSAAPGPGMVANPSMLQGNIGEAALQRNSHDVLESLRTGNLASLGLQQGSMAMPGRPMAYGQGLPYNQGMPPSQPSAAQQAGFAPHMTFTQQLQNGSQPIPGIPSSAVMNPQSWDAKVLADAAAHFTSSTDPESQARIKTALAAAMESANKAGKLQGGQTVGLPQLAQQLGISATAIGGPGSGQPGAPRYNADDLAKSLMSMSRQANPQASAAPPQQSPYAQGTTQDLIQMVGEMAAQKYPTPKSKERDDTVLQRVPVICNGNKGVFLVGRQVIVCLCAECENRAKNAGVPEMELSPTDFERHSGSHTSKKWKYTVKVLETDANGNERPAGAVGAWLDKYAAPGSVPRRQHLGYSSILGDVAPTALPQNVKRPGGKKFDSPSGLSSLVPKVAEASEHESDPSSDSRRPPASRSGQNRRKPMHGKPGVPVARGPRPETVTPTGGPEGAPVSGSAGGPSALEALALAANYEQNKAGIDTQTTPEGVPESVSGARRGGRAERVRKKPKRLGGNVEDYQDDSEETEDEDLKPGRGKKRGAATNQQVKAKRPRRTSSRVKDEPPRVAKWNAINDGFLQVVVEKDGKVYTGALMHQSHMVPELEEEEEDIVDYDSESDYEIKSNKKKSGKAKRGGRAHSVESPDLVVDDDLRSGKKKIASSEKKQVNEKRREAAGQDYERLAEEGPPPDTKCALCHRGADPDLEGSWTTEDARGEVDFDILERKPDGLGPLLLVKSSAIMNTWVHVQCCLWSPEVYVNTAGDVERASEAVRRGRMLKCKICNEKGATLGCHKRSCRFSYHLPCARESGCALEGVGDEDYLVKCKEHANANDKDLVDHMPPAPDSITADREPRPRGRSAGGAAAALRSGWDMFPKDTQNLDTLTAAASAMRVGNGIENAANPLAAHHFGGTVGQSVLRPGRCAVCVVQRKGVCGTQTAPKKCLRRLALEAAGREIPEAPPGWRTRRPMAHWPADTSRSTSRPATVVGGNPADQLLQPAPVDNRNASRGESNMSPLPRFTAAGEPEQPTHGLQEPHNQHLQADSSGQEVNAAGMLSDPQGLPHMEGDTFSMGVGFSADGNSEMGIPMHTGDHTDGSGMGGEQNQHMSAEPNEHLA